MVPDVWGEVLKEVLRITGDAIIAGGCLRDLYANRQIKDVDIFCNADEFKHGSWEAKLRKYFPDIQASDLTIYQDGRPRQQDSGIDRHIFAIYNLERGDTKFEIIIGDKNTCSIERFDIGICQIFLTPNGEVWATSHFVDGMANKEIKIIDPRPPERMAERIQRLATKFPDFTVMGEVA